MVANAKEFERVYTIGCFDYFHDGHKKLLNKLRKLGNTVIVGIHDDTSLEKLKKLQPEQHQPLETRINSILPHIDQLYVIPSTDPSLYLKAMLHPYDTPNTGCFIRGDDMQNFPGIEQVKNRISVRFLPYTQGVSSTQIRKKYTDYLLSVVIILLVLYFFASRYI